MSLNRSRSSDQGTSPIRDRYAARPPLTRTFSGGPQNTPPSYANSPYVTSPPAMRREMVIDHHNDLGYRTLPNIVPSHNNRPGNIRVYSKTLSRQRSHEDRIRRQARDMSRMATISYGPPILSGTQIL